MDPFQMTISYCDGGKIETSYPDAHMAVREYAKVLEEAFDPVEEHKHVRQVSLASPITTISSGLMNQGCSHDLSRT